MQQCPNMEMFVYADDIAIRANNREELTWALDALPPPPRASPLH